MQVQNSCIILLCSECLLRKHLQLPSRGQSVRVRATGHEMLSLRVVSFHQQLQQLFLPYFLQRSKVVYMCCGKYLSFLVLEICNPSPLHVASFNERFKHNQNICSVDAETWLGSGGPVLRKPLLWLPLLPDWEGSLSTHTLLWELLLC